MPKFKEWKFVIGGLAFFSLWLFVFLPLYYGPPHPASEGMEYWNIAGLHLKITDALIAVFTGLVFLATLALFSATRDLVRGGKRLPNDSYVPTFLL